MCHHQIIFSKLCLKVASPPPYKREIWHYNRAKIDLIRRSIETFNWNRALVDMSVDEQVDFLNNTLMNIFRNFIPHEEKTVKSKEQPWLSKRIVHAVRKTNRLYKKYISGGKKHEDEIVLQENKVILTDLITNARESYFSNLSNKLNDPTTSSKTYWSILKRFINNVKIPNIPPLLVNGVFESDFQKKAEIFNSYFIKQCTILDNGSTLPEPTFKTNKRLTSIIFSSQDMFKIIQELNPNKAHGHDNISIKMIKLCGDSIIPPLKLIFETAVRTRKFPDSWKQGNVIPVHKKNEKYHVNNYRPISLLPIFGKVFEKVIYNNLYKYFHENKLLTSKQSGFRSGDSCVSQLIAITHDIFQSFDCNPSLETRGVFLDISKAFDKVWHNGLFHKLKMYGIDGDLYDLLLNYLQNRKQRVVLNGQHSCWSDVQAGVPQGSILGPLLFLIYINDIPDNITSSVKLFADDTSIFSKVLDVNASAENLNHDLSVVNEWAFQWKMSFNPDPNKQANEVRFSHKRKHPIHPLLFFNNTPVLSVPYQKHLGLVLDEKLNFSQHLNEKISKVNKGIGLIKRLYRYLPRHSLLNIYKSFIRPHLDYGDVIYDQPLNETFKKRIESIQYNAALAITGAIKGTSREKLYNELGIESLSDRRWHRRLTQFFKIAKLNSPSYLKSLLPDKIMTLNPTRTDLYRSFFCHTDYFKNSFFPSTVLEWNKLSPEIRNSESVHIFKRKIKKGVSIDKCSIFNIHDPKGIKLLTRLRVGLSHLREHKFRHNFQNTLNPLCSCNLEPETTSHYLLRCSFYNNLRKSLLDKISTCAGQITNLTEDSLVSLLLYGNINLPCDLNRSILEATIVFLKLSERFDMSLI